MSLPEELPDAQDQQNGLCPMRKREERRREQREMR
jgi:hypothetical protein